MHYNSYEKMNIRSNKDTMKNKNTRYFFIKKTEQNPKLQIIILVVLSLIVFSFYFIFNAFIPEKNDYRLTSELKLINQIEDINIKDNKIIIKGYAFLLDEDSDDIEISILLRSINDGKEIWTDVKQTFRTDVSSFFNSVYNCENSGFNATIKERKLNKNECYEIIVKLDFLSDKIDDGGISQDKSFSKTVLTNRYIINGELYSYNPFVFEHPNIESDLLKEVFTYGQLCFYQKDEGMYVYQYKDQLYWVANEIFNFNENGLTQIPCNTYTSQVDKLPGDRIQNGFETLGFVFEKNKYTHEITTPYQVAIWDIPDNYPIIYITTGAFDTVNNEWVWNKTFHVNHIFK